MILDGDPLADIHNIRKVRFVMQGGRLIDPSAFPEKPVLSQKALLLNPDSPDMKRTSPGTFRVRFETSRGDIVMDLNRDWAPLGVDRFYNLVRNGYYDGDRFFRVMKDRGAQVGVNGDPKISTLWRTRTIADDPRRESNVRGTVAFAAGVANGRATQIFINTSDNSASHDAEAFAPIGKIIEGMDVADALYSEYGETPGSCLRAGRQDPLFDEGNAYLNRKFPRLDWIKRAAVVEAPAETKASE